MEPTGSNDGVFQKSVPNESVPTFKNTFKVLLWAIMFKKEVRKDADCQQILCTYIKIVMGERKQSGQNGTEVIAEKIFLTIQNVAAAAAADAVLLMIKMPERITKSGY